MSRTIKSLAAKENPHTCNCHDSNSPRDEHLCCCETMNNGQDKKSTTVKRGRYSAASRQHATLSRLDRFPAHNVYTQQTREPTKHKNRIAPQTDSTKRCSLRNRRDTEAYTDICTCIQYMPKAKKTKKRSTIKKTTI